MLLSALKAVRSSMMVNGILMTEQASPSIFMSVTGGATFTTFIYPVPRRTHCRPRRCSFVEFPATMGDPCRSAKERYAAET